jgi:hypothetical protein
MWGGVHGGGARTVNRDVFISAAAIAYMYSGGYTYHFQRGLESRVPAQNERVQNGVAAALREIATFLPDDLTSGASVHPGAHDFGLAWKAESHAQSLVDRAYGVVRGDRQWVVVPMPAPGWTPQPANGWRIEAVGPVPYLLQLGRSRD